MNPTTYLVTLNYENGESLTPDELQSMIYEDVNLMPKLDQDPCCEVTVEIYKAPDCEHKGMTTIHINPLHRKVAEELYSRFLLDECYANDPDEDCIGISREQIVKILAANFPLPEPPQQEKA